MAALGPRALLDIAVPTGWDAGEILRFEMEDGIPAAEVVALAATAVGEANQMLEQKYGGIVTFTEQNRVRYRQGETLRTMTPTKAEFAQEPGIRSDQIGHMLPRVDFEDAVAWSRQWLMRADRELINFDLELVVDRWINRFDYDVINRIFSATENAISTAGYDVPWVNGTAGSVDYVPPQWRGNIFAAAHTHFTRTNAAISASNVVTALDDMAVELAEHGHVGRKIALVSQSDVAIYTAMTDVKWAPLVPGEFNRMAGSSNITVAIGELMGIPGELFGYFLSDYGVVEMYYHERIPTGYLAMTKSYGVGSSRNGLAVRLEPGQGFGMIVDPQVNQSMNPELEKILFRGTHGVGVNDRLNGCVYQIASGGASYSSPTIS